MTKNLAGLPPGHIARVVVTFLTAAWVGVWLWRRSHSPDAILTPRIERAAGLLRNAIVGLSVFWGVVWLLLAVVRIRYPFELEWCGGAMRDHCQRLLEGKPLYVAPSADWIPYEYPPLYPALCALLMFLSTGLSYGPMRFVSILCAIGCARIIFLWVRRRLRIPAPAADLDDPRMPKRYGDEATARTWAIAAMGLFFVAYRFTGAWYDIERGDMLFVFLSLLGGYLLESALERPSTVRRAGSYAFLSALAFSAAFLTKQQASLFIVAGAAALAWRGEWGLTALFAAVSLAFCGDAVWLLNATSGGWFGYYVFRVPLANGISPVLIPRYFFADLPLFAPCLALIAMGLRERKGLQAFRPGGDAVLFAMTVAAVVGGFLSRAHWGGYENVLIPVYVFLGMSACVVAGRWERAHRRAVVPLLLLALTQMVALFYNPLAQIPTPSNYASGVRITRIIRALETDGPVLHMQHGGLTTPPHFQIMALGDVERTERGWPPEVMEALRSHRFSAIVTDSEPKANDPILRYYAPAESPQIGDGWVVTGYATPIKPGQIRIFRPRP